MGNKFDNIYITYCDISRQRELGKLLIFDKIYVYDVTNFINEHPGGKSSIENKCNSMTVIDYDLYFHSKRAIRISKTLRIGKVRKCNNKECKICNLIK